MSDRVLRLGCWQLEFDGQPLGARYDPERQVLTLVKMERGDAEAARRFYEGQEGWGKALAWTICYNIGRGLGITVHGSLAECWKQVEAGANFAIKPKRLGEKCWFIILWRRPGEFE